MLKDTYIPIYLFNLHRRLFHIISHPQLPLRNYFTCNMYPKLTLKEADELNLFASLVLHPSREGTQLQEPEWVTEKEEMKVYLGTTESLLWLPKLSPKHSWSSNEKMESIFLCEIFNIIGEGVGRMFSVYLSLNLGTYVC